MHGFYHLVEIGVGSPSQPLATPYVTVGNWGWPWTGALSIARSGGLTNLDFIFGNVVSYP